MISTDLPISKSTEDTLNRASFAKSLAKTISQYSFPSSFTIGLYGEWGSGKTSLVNMVLEFVEEIDENTIILRFNPWLCTEPKQLITQFFKQMAAAIKLKRPWKETAWKLIDQYADNFFDVTSLFPGAGGFVSLMGGKLTKWAQKKYQQRSEDLQERKNQIIEKMKEENLKIVVSIDDIDRLSEDEIVAVFQLVKALADFPNTVYILAFDYDVVVRALGKVQHGDGKEYLEKIIQVPFEIPAPEMASIYDALTSRLNAILNDIPEERWSKSTWMEFFEHGLKKYIKSLRDVIRYINVFTLKYELLKEETDPVDLLALTSLQVFEPSVYSKLPGFKDMLCGSVNNYSYEQQKRNEEKVKRAASLILPDDGTVTDMEAAKNILGILFPKIKAIEGIAFGIGREYSYRNFLINHNIAAPECFDRYFALALESESIPSSLMKNLIYEATEQEFDDAVMQLYREGKIVRLLEEITAYAQMEQSVTISSERAAVIITVMMRRWSSFEVDDRGMFATPFAWRLIRIVEYLLKRMDSTARVSCMHSVFEDTSVQASTLALVLQSFEMEHGRFTEQASVRDDAVFSLDAVLALEEIFKRRAIQAIDSGAALQQRKGLDFLWLLGQIDGKLAADIKNSFVSDDTSLVKVISYCTSRGTIATIKSITKTRTVKREYIGEFIDVDEAYQRMKKFAGTSLFFQLPKDDQINAVAFILISERTERTPVDPMRDNCIAEDVVLKELEKLE